jgi:hypothetical protein
MPPKANQNTQLIVLGLAAAAAASLLFLWLQQQKDNEKAAVPSSKKVFDDDDEMTGRSMASDTSTTKASNATTSTSTKPAKKLDDEWDEKTLHAKIEELDKKGKAYFKNKQVRSISLHYITLCMNLLYSTV